jgi:hypothetical protein
VWLSSLSPDGVEKSMTKFKRAGLVALQLLVVLAIVAATVIMFMHPKCIEHMLAEVARGGAAGLLLAGVKVLVVVNRPKMVCKPVLCWCHFGWAATWHEVKYGLASGYLLGLVVAMWFWWNI